jgi:DNA-binding NtrC family response regulator
MSQQALEKYKIEDALTRTGWIKSQAAKLLKISRTTLDYKIKQYGLSQS